jgi:hypothetical protein
VRAGVAWWLAVGFYVMVLSAGLTYCRIRCESGTPSIWMLTHSEMKFLPVRLFGSDIFRVGGTMDSLPCLTQFFWLIHGGFFNQATVYQMEAFQLADAVGVRRRGMVWAGLTAVAVGLMLAFVMFLTTYYDFGTNVLAGGESTGTGGVRIDYCLQSWKEAATYIATPASPEGARRGAFASGAVVTLLLLAARAALLQSRLSPLGYLMAAVNGMQLWWAFLLAWGAKTVVLKLGGGSAYRRYVPFFLGIAIGHFFLAGVVWGTISMFVSDNSYIIWFT